VAKATDEFLSELHLAIAHDLLAKVKGGTATPAEINAAIKFLKDNGIENGKQNGNMAQLAKAVLPEFDDEGDHTYQ
jgi:hypothetical protein